MNFPPFKKLALWTAGFALTLLGGTYQAQASEYPSRTIKIVVPYAAGGSTDALARIMGEKISGYLGQPVVVDNRGGAASNIGVGAVAAAEPDGYTLGLATSTALSVNPSIYKQLPFDPVKSFEPIVLATILPSFVLINSNTDIDNIEDFHKHLKQNSGKLSYASSGAGSAPHLGAELYRAALGFDAVHVPYRGGAPALTGLAAGDTDFMVAVTPEAKPLLEGNKLKALAVTTQQRLPAYPNVPTVSESGIPNYELIWGFGFVAPKGTPAPVVDRLNKAFNKALQEPDVVARLQGMGYEIVGGEAAKLTEVMENDRVKWGKIVKDLNITAD